MMRSTIKTKVIGVNIDVAVTTIAVVDQRGNILAEDRMATKDYPDVNRFMETLSERIINLAEANGGYEEIRSVGIGAPSGNYQTASIENAVNLPWKGVIPMAAMLRDRIGLAVALGNDVHTVAMGESVYGAGHGMTNFVVVMLSNYGVGSCIFSNGQPHLGVNGSAGELGHCCVVDGGRLCNCGRRGCLEEYASYRGIVKTAQELMNESQQPSLMRDLEKLTPEAIGLCADKGDEMAKEVWLRTGHMLGMALANTATILNPEAVILTGQLLNVLKWMVEPTQETFNKYVFHNIRDKVKLVVSDLLSDERSVLGAAALAWTVKEYSLFK